MRDLISRQALIELIDNAEENFKIDNMDSISSNVEDPFVDGVLSGVFNIRQMVAQAPSVTPTRKKGHWIDHSDEGFVECSECGSCWTNCDGNTTDLHFCYSCGAKMAEDKYKAESEG